jgi:hypothetical protein
VLSPGARVLLARRSLLNFAKNAGYPAAMSPTKAASTSAGSITATCSIIDAPGRRGRRIAVWTRLQAGKESACNSSSSISMMYLPAGCQPSIPLIVKGCRKVTALVVIRFMMWRPRKPEVIEGPVKAHD